MNVLFLSKDNIGRSQIAEAWFNHLSSLARKNYRAVSAATEMVGDNVPLGEMGEVTENIIEAMYEDSIDISRAVRKPLTAAFLQENSIDWIVFISTESFPENIIKHPRLIHWNIWDPKGQSMDDTRNIKNMIKDQVLELWKGIDEYHENKSADSVDK